MPRVELTLPYPPRVLHPNARVHYHAKARAVKQYRDQCWAVGYNRRQVEVDAFPLATPVTAQATFIVKTKAKRDEDGLAASIKALWDGLVDAKVLSADDATALHLAPVRIELGKEPAVRVVLEPAS